MNNWSRAQYEQAIAKLNADIDYQRRQTERHEEIAKLYEEGSERAIKERDEAKRREDSLDERIKPIIDGTAFHSFFTGLEQNSNFGSTSGIYIIRKGPVIAYATSAFSIHLSITNEELMGVDVPSLAPLFDSEFYRIPIARFVMGEGENKYTFLISPSYMVDGKRMPLGAFVTFKAEESTRRKLAEIFHITSKKRLCLDYLVRGKLEKIIG